MLATIQRGEGTLARVIRGRVFGLLASATTLLVSLGASAQSNFEGTQIGGRTAMMGGAAVASGADEATAFMNPAGLTRIPGQSFSFSTFAVQIGNRSIGDALDPDDALKIEDADTGQIQLRIIPNTYCLFLNGPPKDNTSRRSRHKYALCAASTERERMEFTENRENGFYSNSALTGAGHSTRMDFVRSTLALGWGIELSRETSLGVTWRVDNARFSDSTTASAFAADGGIGGMQTVSLARDAWSWDTSIVVGFTANLTRTATLGVSLTTPSQHLLGSYTGVGAVSATGARPESLMQDTGDFRYNHPGSVRMGMAFSWPQVLFEFNGSFYGPQKHRARADLDRRTSAFDAAGVPATSVGRAGIFERGRPVANVAVGAEYFVESDFSIITGAQTDFSGLPDRSDTPVPDVLFRQSKDTVHVALGVSSYGQRGNVLLGLRGNYSWGQALIADPTRAQERFVALSQKEWGLGFIVSGRISFQAVRDTAFRAATPLTQLPSIELGGDDDEDGESDKSIQKEEESR